MAQPTAPFTRRQQLVGDKPHWIDASQHFFTYDDPVRTAPNKCRWGKFKTIVGITTPEANGSLSLDHVPSQTLQIVQKGQTSVDEINQFRYPPPPPPNPQENKSSQHKYSSVMTRRRMQTRPATAIRWAGKKRKQDYNCFEH
jgi:hypothetical protein